MTTTCEVDAGGGTPYATIQSAIDAATPGQDEVLVRCGVYLENLVMRDGVSVRGERPECTIIDGQEAGPVVSMTSIGAGTELSSFTIRNGKSLSGGGVLVHGGQPLITRNIIRDNGTPVFGDGFYDLGAGIYVSSGGFDPNTAPTISFNIIKDNSAFSGGGILLGDTQGVVVTSNLIVGNLGSFGGGLYVGGDASILNNNFIGNVGDYGGAIGGHSFSGTIANNVFYLNVANGSYGDFWTPTLNSVTYAANVSYANPPKFYGSGLPPSGVLEVAPEFTDTRSESFAGFQPRSSSPLIDAAAMGIAVPIQDLRQISRPLDGDVDGVSHPDIGARENEGVTGFSFDGTLFDWDPATPPSVVYNVYRGNLQQLRQNQIYTQDPLIIPGALHFCGGPVGLTDTDEPGQGEGFFYLVTAVGTVEGTLGFDSALVERPRSLACQ